MIEGFYGTPWSPEARRRLTAYIARHGMNAYVYAPKDDPFHRSRWREPYPPEQLEDLLGLHEHCRDVGVRFGFAVSPGLDFEPGVPSDRDTLWAKLTPFLDAGVDWVVLGFDDVPLREGAGRAHGELAAWLRDRLPPSARLGLVPTDYVGTARSPYLDELAAVLPSGTDLFWTGRTVVPTEITAGEARARVEATGGFPLVVWDNYPVNDAFMDASLHLGPLRGRDPELADVAAGLLANPMIQPLASLIPLFTVAAFLSDPRGYDHHASIGDAARDVALELGCDTRPIELLAGACFASRLAGAEDDPVHGLVEACERGVEDAHARLDSLFGAAATLSEGLPSELLEELSPWVEQAAREASAGRAALDVLDPSGDDWSRVMATMGMLVVWAAARRASDRVVFGPRFACYPAIVQTGDGTVRVDGDAALVEDANAVDRLCRHALRTAGSLR